ncbi:MAG: hypothetical protein ACR2KK_12225 [Acidimicrobiales bacterium]
MATALLDLAEAAEETARDQQKVARRARALDRERGRGVSWAQLLERGSLSGLLDLLAASATRILDTTGNLRRVIVDSLGDEGLSTRQIARWMGVSHQRISALRNRRG